MREEKPDRNSLVAKLTLRVRALEDQSEAMLKDFSRVVRERNGALDRCAMMRRQIRRPNWN